jgi:hypothetical protein
VPSGAQARVRRELGLAWSTYVESLGIPYPGPKKRRGWTDETVLAEIRRRRRRGQALSAEGLVRDVGQGLIKQARQRFGSWEEALRAAGVDPRREQLRRRWTRDQILAAIRARGAAGQSLRRRDVFTVDPSLAKAAAYCFPHSWERAVRAAGLQPTSPPRPVGRARPRKHR